MCHIWETRTKWLNAAVTTKANYKRQTTVQTLSLMLPEILCKPVYPVSICAAKRNQARYANQEGFSMPQSVNLIHLDICLGRPMAYFKS